MPSSFSNLPRMAPVDGLNKKLRSCLSGAFRSLEENKKDALEAVGADGIFFEFDSSDSMCPVQYSIQAFKYLLSGDGVLHKKRIVVAVITCLRHFTQHEPCRDRMINLWGLVHGKKVDWDAVTDFFHEEYLGA